MKRRSCHHPNFSRELEGEGGRRKKKRRKRKKRKRKALRMGMVGGERRVSLKKSRLQIILSMLSSHGAGRVQV